MTTESLLRVFGDHEVSSLVLENRPCPHLDVAPDTVWLAIWGGYKILVRWSPRQQRVALHEMSLSAGPDIYYSTNSSICVKAKVAVPLVCLVQGLLRARVPSVIVVHFGMKRPLHYFTDFARADLTYVCQNRYDIGYNVHNNTIPALWSPEATVRQMYVESGRGGGSLELHKTIQGVDVTIKVYPLVMHPLKSLVSPTIAIPKNVKGMRGKIAKFKDYLRELRQRGLQEQLGGYRVEMCVTGNISLGAAMLVADQAKQQMMDNAYCIDVTADMRMQQYVDIVEAELNRCSEVCRGANVNRLTEYQQCVLARLFNAAGFHYGRWYRHVYRYQVVPLSHSPSPAEGLEQHQALDEATLREIVQARHCLQTRAPPGNRTRICGITIQGGCTTSFASVDELAEWAVLHFSGNWRTDLMLTSTPMPPLSPTTEEPDPEQAEMAEFAQRADRILPSVSGTIVDVLGTMCQLHTATTWVHLIIAQEKNWKFTNVVYFGFTMVF